MVFCAPRFSEYLCLLMHASLIAALPDMQHLNMAFFISWRIHELTTQWENILNALYCHL